MVRFLELTDCNEVTRIVNLDHVVCFTYTHNGDPRGPLEPGQGIWQPLMAVLLTVGENIVGGVWGNVRVPNPRGLRWFVDEDAAREAWPAFLRVLAGEGSSG